MPVVCPRGDHLACEALDVRITTVSLGVIRCRFMTRFHTFLGHDRWTKAEVFGPHRPPPNKKELSEVLTQTSNCNSSG